MFGRRTAINKKRLFSLLELILLDAVWLAIIFGHSLQNAASSSEESGRLLSFLQNLFPFMTDHIIRKLAHFSEFFILGGLFTLTTAAASRPMLLPPLLGGLLAAVTDELLQLTSVGRSCQVSDMLLDFSGVLTAAVFLMLLFALTRKKQAHKK